MEINHLIIILIIILILFGFMIYDLQSKKQINNNTNSNKHIYIPQGLNEDHDAHVLLLTCIDFRTLNDTHNYMKYLGYNDDYDHFILAGASLGVNQTEYPQWKSTFWRHLQLSDQLHNIQKIIVIDHSDCGAYKLFYPDANITLENEFPYHVDNILKLKKAVNILHPQIAYEGYFLHYNGVMQRIV